MAAVIPLDPESLSLRCNPEQFDFKDTSELEDLLEVIGQERALHAIKFAIGIQKRGYNLFALGPNGTGKYTSVLKSISERAAGEPAPSDWCYVYNFDQPHKPNALELPASTGSEFRSDMNQLVEELFVILPSTFEDDEYQSRKKAIETEFQEKQETALKGIRVEAEKKDIALIRTPQGLAFAPLQEKEVIKPEEFLKLPEEQRKEIEQNIGEFQEQLQKVIRQVPQWIRENRTRVIELNEEVASFTTAPLLEELKEKYIALIGVQEFLTTVEKDIIKNNDMFLASREDGKPSGGQQEIRGQRAARDAFAIRYQVNLLIDHSNTQGAPIVFEQNPTYPNLIGRLEHVAQMGTLLTDFTLIKPGALHKANGGYLILDARKLLTQNFSWEGIKRALQQNEIVIESPGQAYGLASTVGVDPEPIPLDLKVVLLGDRQLYYLLHQNDPEFGELFKVAADFEGQMERTPDSNLAYANLIATLARKEKLLHFDRGAVARVIEQSARIVGDAEKLSAHMQSVADLLRESDYWAGQEGADLVTPDHVNQAIRAQIYRASRIKDRIQEQIIRETILIDTDGSKVGQINGLSVLMLGNYAFGRPSRITARIRLGKGEVIDIERQVELGGPIHSKGVLILSSYLGSHYASERPLSLTASLVFEQSYGGVDGDSASSAELYALLSALADVPINQSFAVTGSVNQYGEVQAIGGANEKIEGFFDLCKNRGLTGNQGVLIPAANVKNLMLKTEVVTAVSFNQFHIYPIETIDQGIGVLTGVPAGQLDEKDQYPEGTINQRVIERLEKMAATQQAYSQSQEDDEGIESKND